MTHQVCTPDTVDEERFYVPGALVMASSLRRTEIKRVLSVRSLQTFLRLYKTWHRASTKINCLQLQQYEKYACWTRMLVCCEVWMLQWGADTAGSFRNYWLHCPNLYPSDSQTGDVVPCDPIARAFEEKDGFLVSGSPILLHDNYVFTSNENDTANHWCEVLGEIWTHGLSFCREWV